MAQVVCLFVLAFSSGTGMGFEVDSKRKHFVKTIESPLHGINAVTTLMLSISTHEGQKRTSIKLKKHKM